MDRRTSTLTIDRVVYESRYFLNGIVHDLLEERDGVEANVPVMDQPEELPPEHIIEIKRAIRFIIDAQEEDDELNALASRVPPEMNTEVTLNVARRIFDDGIFNWGRVISLFYFAYKVCKKTVNLIGLFRSIIDCIIDFMKERVIDWILQQGGWEGLREFVRHTNAVNWIVFGSVAVAAGAGLVYKYVR